MDEAKMVREKKHLYYVFFDDIWQEYLEAKRAAKKAVATTEAKHYHSVTKRLDAENGGELSIYWLARSRQQQTAEVEKF
ncbi:hypothetical protein Y032_0102g3427 [Ancylostoma ceylanicum]|uniref:Uncharacterized protein n=1 Tax=Ancylostoma ceylanicum TaxID=53326 RepID=A0A016TH42_9BILA|nr:hypothetical protein Y032_0102g3427 [Ancylostoma ceylanicum]